MPEGVGYGPHNVIGNFAYAYSGKKQINTSNVEHLNFTTGNYIFVGELSIIGAVDTADLALGDISGFTVTFNGVDAFTAKVDTEHEDMPNPNAIPMIIPPYTVVEVNVITDATTIDHFTAANLNGRIYK